MWVYIPEQRATRTVLGGDDPDVRVSAEQRRDTLTNQTIVLDERYRDGIGGRTAVPRCSLVSRTLGHGGP